MLEEELCNIVELLCTVFIPQWFEIHSNRNKKSWIKIKIQYTILRLIREEVIGKTGTLSAEIVGITSKFYFLRMVVKFKRHQKKGKHFVNPLALSE